MATKKKPVKQNKKESWYKAKQVRYVEYELYNQGIIIVNTHGMETEDVVFNNIKEFCRRNLFKDEQMKRVFNAKEESHIKDVYRHACFEEQNAGFVFRFRETPSLICITVCPSAINESLNQYVIYQYLVHEVTHCANRILDYCGIKLPRTLDEAEDENHCLLIDNIFKKAAEMFDKTYFLSKKSS